MSTFKKRFVKMIDYLYFFGGKMYKISDNISKGLSQISLHNMLICDSPLLIANIYY